MDFVLDEDGDLVKASVGCFAVWKKSFLGRSMASQGIRTGSPPLRLCTHGEGLSLFAEVDAHLFQFVGSV